MSQYKRIFIIGHPGAGKALLAKTVAEKLGWQFIDADLGLEFHIGRSLDEILGEQGQEAFYDCQSEILTSLLSQKNIVVAMDASIVCCKKNQQLLSSEFVVFLNVSTPVQVARTSRNFLPLLPVINLEEFLDKLHIERDNLYRKIAILTINSDDNMLETHVVQITQIILGNKDIKLAVKSTLDKKDLTILHKNLHIPVHLSEQQATCLKLLAQGKTSKEIARDINISYRTVEGNLAKIMGLLGCSSSKELIALYHSQP